MQIKNYIKKKAAYEMVGHSDSRPLRSRLSQQGQIAQCCTCYNKVYFQNNILLEK